MYLDTLPSELIYNISLRVCPETIQFYAATCHRIRSVALPLIIEDRELFYKYDTCRFDADTASDALREICVRPWIRHYPRHLELMVRRETNTANYLPTSEKISDLGEAVMNTSAKHDIQNSGLVEPDELDDWIQQLKREEEGDLFALLLMVLSNVRSLQLRLYRGNLKQMKDVFRRIQKHPDSHVLSKVKTIKIWEQYPHRSENLELFPLAATLPNVEQMYCTNLVGMFRDCYSDDWKTYPGASSTITSITLETCGMSAGGLEVLLKPLKNLQVFKYIAHRSRWGLGDLAILLHEASGTLHTLEVSANSGTSRFVGNLKSFTALKILKLDTDMVIRNGKMQRAVDLLPASIECVTLCGNNLKKSQEQEFVAELCRPAYTYPYFKSIGVDDSYGRREIGKAQLRFQREFQRQTALLQTRKHL